METQNTNRLSKHHVENLVISCIDFRFKDDIGNAIKETFNISDYDEIKLAGASGNLAGLGTEERLKTVLADLSLAVSAHQVKNIYLLTHQNCGAYSKAGHSFPIELSPEEVDFHKNELESAKKIVIEKFPSVLVHTGFVEVESDDKLHIIS